MDSYLLTYLRSQNIKVAKTVKIKKKRRIVAGKMGFLFEGGALSSNHSFFLIFFSILSVVCSHIRATQYFIASVKGSCSWTAYPCDDYQSFKQKKCPASACNGTCPSMGFEADSPKGEGKFYLSTDENDPFCGKFFPPKK